MTTSQNRAHFKFVVPSAYPVLIVRAGSRHTLFIVNEGADGTRIGFSGSISNGMYMATKSIFEDAYSQDEWWAIAPSSSGSVSGYIVY